jgi:DNA-directed RNA polymerase specialized sigma subunit
MTGRLKPHVVDTDDLVQAGLLAYLGAQQTYDESKGPEDNYFRRAIKNAVYGEAFQFKDVTIHRSINSYRQKILKGLGDGRTDEQIRAELNLSLDMYNAIKRIKNQGERNTNPDDLLGEIDFALDDNFVLSVLDNYGLNNT